MKSDDKPDDVNHRAIYNTSDSKMEDDKENSISYGFKDLLIYCDYKDKINIFTGLFLSLVSGANQPAQLIVFGQILNSFNLSDSSDALKNITFLSILYLVLGIQIFVTTFLQSACMSTASAKLTARLRESYFAALIKQVSFINYEIF
jgi:ATP-binding cassette subfamily B (MDR/TAP) protein 1